MRRGHAAIVLVIWWWWMATTIPVSVFPGTGGCGNFPCAVYWGPLEELDGTPLVEEPELEVRGPYITEEACEGELGKQPFPGWDLSGISCLSQWLLISR